MLRLGGIEELEFNSVARWLKDDATELKTSGGIVARAGILQAQTEKVGHFWSNGNEMHPIPNLIKRIGAEQMMGTTTWMP